MTVKPNPLPLAAPTRWIADRVSTASQTWALPALPIAIGRGLAMRCPACGQAKLFDGYLTVKSVCPSCGAPLGLARADDAPPYFTIFIVGHIIVGSMLILEKTYEPPLWVHAVVWLPLTLAMAMLLLRPIKGATVALMLKLGMFKSGDEE